MGKIHAEQYSFFPTRHAAGLTGDLITAVTGKPFYITSSRYRSMVTDYIVPMEKTYALLGPPKTSLQQGVAETVSWLASRRNTVATHAVVPAVTP